ncbi:hypothetical protein D9M72_499600 [compost metagenome]
MHAGHGDQQPRRRVVCHGEFRQFKPAALAILRAHLGRYPAIAFAQGPEAMQREIGGVETLCGLAFAFLALRPRFAEARLPAHRQHIFRAAGRAFGTPLFRHFLAGSKGGRRKEQRQRRQQSCHRTRYRLTETNHDILLRKQNRNEYRSKRENCNS